MAETFSFTVTIPLPLVCFFFYEAVLNVLFQFFFMGANASSFSFFFLYLHDRIVSSDRSKSMASESVSDQTLFPSSFLTFSFEHFLVLQVEGQPFLLSSRKHANKRNGKKKHKNIFWRSEGKPSADGS